MTAGALGPACATASAQRCRLRLVQPLRIRGSEAWRASTSVRSSCSTRDFGRIDNETVRELLTVSVTEATQVLKRLGERDDLVQVGARRWAHWVPAPKQLKLDTAAGGG